MGLVSRSVMEAVAAVLDSESWMPARTIVARANCGNIRTVRSALTQLREEGRVVRGGQTQNMVYRLVAENEELVA